MHETTEAFCNQGRVLIQASNTGHVTGCRLVSVGGTCTNLAWPNLVAHDSTGELIQVFTAS